MAAEPLKPGDKVTWETSQGETTGKIVRKLTTDTKVKGFTAKASQSDPKYLVESSKTGAKAAHSRSSLEK